MPKSRLAQEGTSLLTTLLLATACHRAAPYAAPSAPAAETALVASSSHPVAEPAPTPPADSLAPRDADPSRRSGKAPAVTCEPADWSDHPALGPLLSASRQPGRAEPDKLGAAQVLFDAECSDSPDGPHRGPTDLVTVDGVNVRLTAAAPAGASKRGWRGNQCQFELRAADGTGTAVLLDTDVVPPFTTITALVRSGSAVWLSLGFNGYRREFPGGGNRVIGLDLCRGRILWQSKDASSNGGLLLLGDYLVSPYGFTSEPRFLFVLDARSGAVLQQLPIVESVCPSESWRPNWHPGERCDAPGQRVGAATNPRISGNLLFVDTNTGSASFALR